MTGHLCVLACCRSRTVLPRTRAATIRPPRPAARDLASSYLFAPSLTDFAPWSVQFRKHMKCGMENLLCCAGRVQSRTRARIPLQLDPSTRSEACGGGAEMQQE